MDLACSLGRTAILVQGLVKTCMLHGSNASYCRCHKDVQPSIPLSRCLGLQLLKFSWLFALRFLVLTLVFVEEANNVITSVLVVPKSYWVSFVHFNLGNNFKMQKWYMVISHCKGVLGSRVPRKTCRHSVPLQWIIWLFECNLCITSFFVNYRSSVIHVTWYILYSHF